MIYTLYKTTNSKNGRFYIGVHSTEDEHFGTEKWIDPYVGSGNTIWKALKKYGRGSFKVEIIDYFPDSKSAYEAESALITEDFLKENKKCYNINIGGFEPPRNGIPSPNQVNTKWINNGEINKRVANSAPIEGWFVGRLFTFSEEELEKRKERMIDRNKKNNPMWKSEVRLKMSKSKLGMVPPNKGKKGLFFWINDGLNSVLHDANLMIPDGWFKGRISLNIGKKI